MRFTDTLALATTALMRNRMRSLLTTLGVIIGVAAVIVMQGMGAGATRVVTDEIASMGSNMLVVVPGAARRQPFGGSLLSAPPFEVSDVEAIRERCPAVRYVSPYAFRPVQVVAAEDNHATNAFGVQPDFFQIRDLEVARGRALRAEDEASAAKRCVVGTTVAREVFGSQDPLGEEIRLDDLNCEVVGVLEEMGVSTFGNDQDDLILVPFRTFAQRIQGGDSVATIMASAVSEPRIDEAVAQIEDLLRERRHIHAEEEADFSVRDMREVQALLGTVTGVLTSMLAGVAAISLLVGGIGIMNIMLVSVTERTREIGVRLAVGARRRDILQQFLVEAVVLSSLGGLIGILLGVFGTWAANRAMSAPFEVPLMAILMAFGFSVLVGVVFGGFPARKASRLRPIDALRAE